MQYSRHSPGLLLSLIIFACTADSNAQQKISIGPGHIAVADNQTEAFQISCSDSLPVNRLVISGGVSAESVSPKDSSEQLNKQLAAMRSFVESKGGKLMEKERLRSARNPEKSSDGSSKQPLIQMQRIEAEFPLSVNIDEAIERLLKLGMDRYGKEAGVDAHTARDYRNLTTYRIAKQEEALSTAVSRCLQQEAARFCPATPVEQCLSKIKLQSAYIRTETISTRDVYRGAQHIVLIENGNPQIQETIEPLGAQNIRIQVQIHGLLAGPAASVNKQGAE